MQYYIKKLGNIALVEQSDQEEMGIKRSQSFTGLEYIIPRERDTKYEVIDDRALDMSYKINDILFSSIQRLKYWELIIFFFAAILCVINVSIWLQDDFKSLVLFETTFSFNNSCISIYSMAVLDNYCVGYGNIDEISTWLE